MHAISNYRCNVICSARKQQHHSCRVSMVSWAKNKKNKNKHFLPNISNNKKKAVSHEELKLTVPNLTYLPEALVTGLAVWAVLGVRRAPSMVPGLPDCVPGLAKPVRGRPDWDIGLKCIKQFEPHRKKTCLCHMRTTKALISLHICAV